MADHDIRDSFTEEQRADYDSWSKQDVYIAYLRASAQLETLEVENKRLWRELAASMIPDNVKLGEGEDHD